MNWFYINPEIHEGDRRTGPLTTEEMHALVREQKITRGTLIWKKGMEDWQPAAMVEEFASDAGFSTPEVSEDSMKIPDAYATPQFAAGESTNSSLEDSEESNIVGYGGFWIRFAALFVDGVVVNALGMILGVLMGVSVTEQMASDPSVSFSTVQWIHLILQVSLAIFYYTWFVGKYGGTPGKLILGLRIVDEHGGPVGYSTAVKRYLATILSALTFGIGYLIAAWDSEKKTLHDILVRTRVVQLKPEK